MSMMLLHQTITLIPLTPITKNGLTPGLKVNLHQPKLWPNKKPFKRLLSQLTKVLRLLILLPKIRLHLLPLMLKQPMQLTKLLVMMLQLQLPGILPKKLPLLPFLMKVSPRKS
jgi:hypothetical protein